MMDYATIAENEMWHALVIYGKVVGIISDVDILKALVEHQTQEVKPLINK